MFVVVARFCEILRQDPLWQSEYISSVHKADTPGTLYTRKCQNLVTGGIFLINLGFTEVMMALYGTLFGNMKTRFFKTKFMFRSQQKQAWHKQA